MPRLGLTPARVVAEAGTLADEVGYESLSLAALAERLGVRVPSLYKHVGGLPDLQRRLALDGMRALDARITEAAVGRAGTDALWSVARAYRQFAHEHPGRYAASLRTSDIDDAELGGVIASLATVVFAALQGYRLEGEAALHAARAVRAALHGFVSLELSHSFGLPEVDESFEKMVDLLDAALLSKAAHADQDVS